MRRIECVLGLLFAANAAGAQPGYGVPECEAQPGPLVRVHLENMMTVPAAVLARAKGVAGGIFAGIGVRLDWIEGAPRPSNKPSGCAGLANEILEVEFDEIAAARFPRDAMAYAVPGKAGICIHIFYTRVVAAHSHGLTPVLLGHVMAHEITHVLEGAARHSEGGLMKAHWSSEDYMQMSRRPLPLAEEDVELVRVHFNRLGLALAGR